MTDTKTQIQRHSTIQRAAIDEAARTVSVLIATPTPVPTMRWIDGSGYIQCNEVLQCTPEAVDTERLDGGISVLMVHRWDDVVGVTISHSIDPDGIRAVIRFTRDPASEPIWQDIVDGIRRHVSVGADIIAQSYDIATNTNTITRWQPYEVSFVAIPADANSGVGRSKQPLQPTPKQPPITMTTPTPTPPTNHAQEIARIAELLGDPEEGLRAIQDQCTTQQFNERMIAKRSKSPLPSGDMGMSDKEVQRYKLSNVLRYLSGDNTVNVDFERDVTNNCKRALQRQNSFYIPPEVQRTFTQRSFDPTSGAGLVAQNTLYDQHIPFARPKYIMDTLGITMLSGLSGRVIIPKTTTSGQVYWIVGTSSGSESSPTVDQVELLQKQCGAYVDVTRSLMQQSGGTAEAFAVDELQRAMMSGLQNAIINGTGLNGQPTGILTAITPTIDGGVNGVEPTYDHLIDLEGAVQDANAGDGFGGYLMSKRAKQFLKKTFEAPDKNTADRLWNRDSATPVNGYAGFATTDVPLTSNSSNWLTPIIHCGDWSSLVVGSWGGMEVAIDTATNSKTGATRIVVLNDVGLAYRNTDSFAVFKNALV